MDITLLIRSLLHIIVGFSIALGVGMTGIGAGVLILPALIHILGIGPVYAVGTGLVYAVIAKLGGAVYHFRLKTVRIRRALYFLIGSIPGVLISSRTVNSLVGRYGTDNVDRYLQIIIGIILLLTAVGMVYQLFNQNQEERKNHIMESKLLPVPLSKKVLAIFFGLLVGICVGTTSIGGGVILISFLILFLDASSQQAVGTSIFISLFLAALGGIVYFIHGRVDIVAAALLCLGAVPGVRLGSQFSKKIPERLLIILVVAIAIVSGLSMFF